MSDAAFVCLMLLVAVMYSLSTWADSYWSRPLRIAGLVVALAGAATMMFAALRSI